MKLRVPLMFFVGWMLLAGLAAVYGDYRQNTAAGDVTTFKSGTISSGEVPWTQGPGATGAAISGNPLRQGFRGTTASPASVTDGQTTDALSTVKGVQIVRPYAIPEETWQFASGASGIVNTTTAVTLKTAGAAGIRNYINSIQINTDTLGAATELAIRDGAAGTVIWRGKLQTTALPLTTINFDPPIKGTAATLTEVVTLTAVTGGVYVNAQGFQAP